MPSFHCTLGGGEPCRRDEVSTDAQPSHCAPGIHYRTARATADDDQVMVVLGFAVVDVVLVGCGHSATDNRERFGFIGVVGLWHDNIHTSAHPEQHSHHPATRAEARTRGRFTASDRGATTGATVGSACGREHV